jgi:hypothetical protein
VVKRPGGYLLVLVAVCVSILSISFLRLAANSAKTDDNAGLEVATTAAFYAAESGLLTAELRLRGLTSPPPEGPWLAGQLETSRARFTVEVKAGSDPKTQFLVRSIGKMDGEANSVVSSTIEAEIVKGPGKAWTVRSRKRT